MSTALELDMCSGDSVGGRTLPQFNVTNYDVSRLGFGAEIDAAAWESIPQPTTTDGSYPLYQCAVPTVPWAPGDPYHGSCNSNSCAADTFYDPLRREMLSASCSSHSTVGYEEPSPPISPCQGGPNTSTLSRLDPVTFATFDYGADEDPLDGFGDDGAPEMDTKSGLELFQYQVPAFNQWNAYCCRGYGVQGAAYSALTGDESGFFGDLNGGGVYEQYETSRAMPCSYVYPTSQDGYSGGQDAANVAAAAAAMVDNEMARPNSNRRRSILDEDIFRSGELVSCCLTTLSTYTINY